MGIDDLFTVVSVLYLQLQYRKIMSKESVGLSRLSVILLVCVLGFASCKEEKPLLDVDLPGKWKVYKAFRNDKPTRTLDGAYILFVDDISLKTNLDLNIEIGADPKKIYNFTRQGAKLVLTDMEPQVILQLETTSLDSIALSTSLGVWDLDMHLVRDTVPAPIFKDI